MEPIFRDEQRADPRFMTFLFIASSPALLVLIKNHAPAWLIALPILLQIAAAIFLRSLRLIVEVHRESIEYKLWPLERRFRRVAIADLASHAVGTWSPLGFGGWGIRGPKRNRVYAMRGKRGVQLVLSDGARLLLGSDRADELDRAIAGVCPRRKER